MMLKFLLPSHFSRLGCTAAINILNLLLLSRPGNSIPQAFLAARKKNTSFIKHPIFFSSSFPLPPPPQKKNFLAWPDGKISGREWISCSKYRLFLSFPFSCHWRPSRPEKEEAGSFPIKKSFFSFPPIFAEINEDGVANKVFCFSVLPRQQKADAFINAKALPSPWMTAQAQETRKHKRHHYYVALLLGRVGDSSREPKARGLKWHFSQARASPPTPQKSWTLKLLSLPSLPERGVVALLRLLHQSLLLEGVGQVAVGVREVGLQLDGTSVGVDRKVDQAEAVQGRGKRTSRGFFFAKKYGKTSTVWMARQIQKEGKKVKLCKHCWKERKHRGKP